MSQDARGQKKLNGANQIRAIEPPLKKKQSADARRLTHQSQAIERSGQAGPFNRLKLYMGRALLAAAGCSSCLPASFGGVGAARWSEWWPLSAPRMRAETVLTASFRCPA